MQLPRDRTGRRPLLVAGLEINAYPIDPNAVDIHDIQEGDIILLRGTAWSSWIIGWVSNGSSHVGQIMKLDDHLWFIESVSWRENGDEVMLWTNNQPPIMSGVTAAALPMLLPWYRKSALYRPTPRLSESELGTMRDEFLDLFGNKYERNWIRLANVVPGIPIRKPAKKKFYCSQLTAHLFKKIGRLKTSYSTIRYKSGDYRPVDIPKAIDCKYKGYFAGTRPFNYEKKRYNGDHVH